MAIVGAHAEIGRAGAVPLIEHFFDFEFVLAQVEAFGPLVGPMSRVALDLNLHIPSGSSVADEAPGHNDGTCSPFVQAVRGLGIPIAGFFLRREGRRCRFRETFDFGCELR